MKIRVFILGVFGVFLLLFLSQKYFFPSDVLNNIPSFSEYSWEKPKNSLLADPVFQFEPWRKFSKEEIRNFRFPLWNNLNGNGSPFFANSQSAVLFPVNFFYYLFPPELSLYLIFFTKLFLVFTFTFLYLRSIKISSPVSILGATALTFSGFIILWLNWPHTNVYIFLPLLLFLTEKIKIENVKKYRYYIAISLSYFFAILGGHPETLFYVCVLHLIYSFYRFRNNKKAYLPFLIWVTLGFLLGAVQLIPFIEYLLNSSAFHTRSLGFHSLYLPVVSFIYNLFPLILGAPHASFYKPIIPGINFQEMSGGYVGLAVITLVLIGFISVRDKSLAKFWFITVIISWVIAYNIWPINLFGMFPPLSLSTNYRFVAFAGFGAVVLFCLILEEILVKKIKNTNKLFYSNIFYISLVVVCLVISAAGFFLFPASLQKHTKYLTEYLLYFNLIFLSTICFFWVLSAYIRKRISKKTLFIFLFITLILQTFVLFWKYNPVTKKSEYYPNIEIVKVLKQQPPGNILEVGNPSLPANVNLAYSIPHAVNNDAMDVLWYRKEFENIFKNKNNWGNPEEVRISDLQKLNISYVLSDFNINLKKKIIQRNSDDVLPPITNDRNYEIEFIPKNGLIKQIRIKTANFNRNNNCNLNILISDEFNKENIFEQNIPCPEIRNNVFLTIPVDLKARNSRLNLSIKSNAVEQNNAVALYGKDNKPYFELLYDTEDNGEKAKLIGKTKSTYIWKVNNVNEIEGVKNYKIIYKNPQKIVIEVHSNKQDDILIKKTFFPGWTAQVNGINTPIQNSHPFMNIKINEGYNYIVLTYKPASFSLGLILSLITGFSIFIYFLRMEYEYGIWIIINKYLNKFRENSKTVNIWQHIVVIILGLVISAISYLILIIPFHPKFYVPYTTTVSWFTVNNYPRQQEYFYLFSAYIYIFLLTIIVWLTYIWKRKK